MRYDVIDNLYDCFVLDEGSLPSSITTPPGFSACAAKSVVRGAPGTLALASCGVVPSGVVRATSFTVSVTFLLSSVTLLDSGSTSSDIGASDDAITSAMIEASSVGVDVLSVEFSSKAESVGKSDGIASGACVGSPTAEVNKALVSLFCSIGGDKVCSKAVGADSLSEPEVRSLPVSVPDDPFG